MNKDKFRRLELCIEKKTSENSFIATLLSIIFHNNLFLPFGENISILTDYKFYQLITCTNETFEIFENYIPKFPYTIASIDYLLDILPPIQDHILVKRKEDYYAALRNLVAFIYEKIDFPYKYTNSKYEFPFSGLDVMRSRGRTFDCVDGMNNCLSCGEPFVCVQIALDFLQKEGPKVTFTDFLNDMKEYDQIIDDQYISDFLDFWSES